METTQLLILDYDGTLADCKPLHQKAFREACLAVNPKIEYEDKEVEGLPTFKKIEYLKNKGYVFDEEVLMQTKQKLTMENINEYIKFDQELKDILTSLSKKYKLAVCSMPLRQFVDTGLKIQKLDMFDPVNTASEHPPKPQVDIYFSAMYQHEVTPMQTVIFEDSELGIKAAYDTNAIVEKVINLKHLKRLLNEY